MAPPPPGLSQHCGCCVPPLREPPGLHRQSGRRTRRRRELRRRERVRWRGGGGASTKKDAGTQTDALQPDALQQAVSYTHLRAHETRSNL
eukprot:5822525-Lingulodinium_polyedra.AAC.1